MSSEPQIIISFIFKRSGKTKLKESEIYLSLSLELAWFTTKEARQFVNFAVQQKLLLKKEGFLSPSFDIEKITIPIGFFPSKKEYIIEKTEIKEENTIGAIIQRIIVKTDKNSNEIYEEIKQVESEKNILSEVAILLVAQKYDIDVKKYFDEIESLISKGNEE